MKRGFPSRSPESAKTFRAISFVENVTKRYGQRRQDPFIKRMRILTDFYHFSQANGLFISLSLKNNLRVSFRETRYWIKSGKMWMQSLLYDVKMSALGHVQ